MKMRIANKKRFYLIVSLTLLLTIGVSSGVYFYNEFRNPDVLFQSEDDDEDIDINNHFNGNKVNILIYGLDKNEYRDKVEQYGIYRSDTIMLATFDFEKNTIDVLSIPRDTYVPIHNTNSKDKANSCFYYASNDSNDQEETISLGTEYLSKTLSDVLGGIPINYYVGITDMDVVNEIVDELGGIEVDVLHDLYADKGKDKSVIEVEKGLQTLNGEQLQYYARYRAYPLGDIDRVKNQQHIVKALFSNIKSTNTLLKVPQIYRLISENIETNLSIKQMTALALFAKDVERESLNTHTLAGDFGDFGGASYWIIDQEERVKLIKELYGIDVEMMAQDPLSDNLMRLNASVNNSTLNVGETTVLSIVGTTVSGQRHNFSVKDTNYSLSDGGIVQINADNTLVAKAYGTVRLNFEVEGISTSISITVRQPVTVEPDPEPPVKPDPVEQPKPKPEPEPTPEPKPDPIEPDPPTKPDPETSEGETSG